MTQLWCHGKWVTKSWRHSDEVVTSQWCHRWRHGMKVVTSQFFCTSMPLFTLLADQGNFSTHVCWHSSTVVRFCMGDLLVLGCPVSNNGQEASSPGGPPYGSSGWSGDVFALGSSALLDGLHWKLSIVHWLFCVRVVLQACFPCVVKLRFSRFRG